MKRNTMIISVLLVLAGALGGWAQVCEQQDRGLKSQVDVVLEQLNERTRELKSYECQIEHEYVQPLLDSKRVRRGMLYYIRSGGKSALRVNFTTVKLEDQKERKAIEQYVVLDGAWLDHSNRQLKGVWLAHLDYELKAVKYYQLAEPEDPNKSIDVFDLVSRNLPMLGFTKTEELKKEFEVALVEQKKGESEDFTQVSLKVKPNSVYKDDFLSVDFWIDNKVGLPAKVRATKTEPEPPYGDVEEILLLKPKVNKDVSRKTFEFKLPRGFGQPEIIPLKKRDARGKDGLGNTERQGL
jgi:outer membrane lipoprotein-sorting protein